MAEAFDRKRLGALKDTVAIVGVGETDYGADYRGAGGRAVNKGEARYDSYTLASRALKRALDDAGLKKDDIDGHDCKTRQGCPGSQVRGAPPQPLPPVRPPARLHAQIRALPPLLPRARASRRSRRCDQEQLVVF